MGRKTLNRKLRKTYAVLGDGITEHYYLKHLKQIMGYGYKISPSLFNRCTLNEASKHIKSLLKQGHEKVIYITDYDTVVNQNTKVQFETFKAKFKDNDKVAIFETMPSLEFWFLLHFQYTTRPFRNAEEAEKELKKHLPNYEKTKKFLGQDNWVKVLCEDGNLQQAITNSEKALKNKLDNQDSSHLPFSKMHLAIEEFETLKHDCK